MDKTIDFVLRAKLIHGDTYNYDNLVYKNTRTKIFIVCKKHGEFSQSPNTHLKGHGCQKCGSKTYTNTEIINLFIKNHGNLYDYSKVEFVGVDLPIKIICHRHGLFKQTPYNHKNGNGCPKCVGKQLNTSDYIKKAKKTHGASFDYTLIDYKKVNSKLKIICPLHGVFEQRANSHLTVKTNPCKECYENEKKNDIINKLRLKHGDEYDYSLVEYTGKDSVYIICKKHGPFKKKLSKLYGGLGCNLCNLPIGERNVSELLTHNNVDFIPQKKFPGCINIRQLAFDFYLPKYNICIEVDGIQHKQRFRGEKDDKELLKRIHRDNIKNEYCIKNSIKLIRVPTKNIKNRLIKILKNDNIYLL